MNESERLDESELPPVSELEQIGKLVTEHARHHYGKDKPFDSMIEAGVVLRMNMPAGKGGKPDPLPNEKYLADYAKVIAASIGSPDAMIAIQQVFERVERRMCFVYSSLSNATVEEMLADLNDYVHDKRGQLATPLPALDTRLCQYRGQVSLQKYIDSIAAKRLAKKINKEPNYVAQSELLAIQEADEGEATRRVKAKRQNPFSKKTLRAAGVTQKQEAQLRMKMYWGTKIKDIAKLFDESSSAVTQSIDSAIEKLQKHFNSAEEQR